MGDFLNNGTEDNFYLAYNWYGNIILRAQHEIKKVVILFTETKVEF